MPAALSYGLSVPSVSAREVTVIRIAAWSRGRGSLRAVAAALAVTGLALAGCGTAASTSQQPGPQSGGSAGSAPAAPASAPASPSGSPESLTGFSVLSMTFVSDVQGFALGTVNCGTGHCLALLGTTDGGAHWTTLTAPTTSPGGVYSTCPHGGPCVQQVRFVTPQIGYAFSPSLFLTTDGGQHWHRLPGSNISSLEAADGSVVRVASGGTGCAGQPYQVGSSAPGSDSWSALPAPRIFMICPPVLYRQGQRVVLAGYGNPAGGTRATAQIDRSADGGRTWASGADSCGGQDGYASGVALAPPDVLVLLCQHQMPQPNGTFLPAWVRISTNNGATFGPDHVMPAPDAAALGTFVRYQLAAASRTRLLVTETGPNSSQLLHTEDGGRTWSTAISMPGTAPVLLVGFEDPETARVAQGNTVWTTTTGGQVWHADSFVAG
jgi:hypothetical protein